MHQQFLKGSISAELVLFEDEQHVWPFMDIDTTASQKALTAMAAFANKHSSVAVV